MESYHRALPIGMPVCGSIQKTRENATWSRFTFTPEWVSVFPKQELFSSMSLSLFPGQTKLC